jgi:hypothetical protein
LGRFSDVQNPGVTVPRRKTTWTGALYFQEEENKFFPEIGASIQASLTAGYRPEHFRRPESIAACELKIEDTTPRYFPGCGAIPQSKLEQCRKEDE